MSNKMKFETDANEYSPSDSEDEYDEEEKHILEKVRKKRSVENFDSDDEVYGLQDNDSENDPTDENEADSMESDIEGQQPEDLPNEKAWGKQKKAFYSTDYVDQDYAAGNQKDMEAAEIEELEAISIQKRLTEQLDDADFGLDLLNVKDDELNIEEGNNQIVKTDLSKLSKRQKQALMLKESPEFPGLVKDLLDRLNEAKNILKPFLKLLERGDYSETSGVNFIRTKYQLILNYCSSILFYLTLKSKRIPLQNHPVIKRLAQYRQLMKQLEMGQGTLVEQVVEILNAAKTQQPIYTSENVEFNVNRKRQVPRLLNHKSKTMRTDVETLAHPNVIEQSDNTIDELQEETEDMEDLTTNNLDETDGKRAITYQIAKNKGLTPHRKKELRNPRVKHRNKYRKAQIRRKGAVREVRKEVTRYSGEMSGIKASVTKSIRLK